MLANSKKEFIDFFKELEDPRQDEKVLYPLDEVVFLAISAVLSCAESWQAIIDYGQNKLPFLRKFFAYEHGIPSKTTVCTLLGSINKNKFEQWFCNWNASLSSKLPKELIAIDGKTIRGSKRKDIKASHVLNAFATQRGLVLAQLKVDGKTNEITAIPEILDNLQVDDTVISIDAMGCQKKIASKIISKNADYFLAVKENQSMLYQDIKAHFDAIKCKQYHEMLDKGHGRTEMRRCLSMPVPSTIKISHPRWDSLSSIAVVENERFVGGKNSIESRYYISSTTADSEKHLKYSREHWKIENQVHWTLDVTFKEDRSQIINAAENMSVIRKVILNIIKKFKTKSKKQTSLIGIRRQSAWSDNVAQSVLMELVA